MNGSNSADGVAETPSSDHCRGGWITFPFIIATTAGLMLASGGWGSNLIVYLIEEFNVKRIDAAQIANIVNGCSNLLPVLGAIIADSFLGCFSVIYISSFISLLGIVAIFLTSTLDTLRPPPCKTPSSLCQPPSTLQFGALYSGIALACLGQGGVRFTLATMGADQFSDPKHQAIYFDWFFFTFYTASIIASTAIVYIQDNVGWAWGYGLSLAANGLGLIVFLFGSRFYHHVRPKGSPFTSLARVVAARIRKRKVRHDTVGKDCYYEHDGEKEVFGVTPTNSFKFFNRASLKTEGDIKWDGSIAKPWKICTVQQVEDLKTLIRILPLWSSSIFLGTPIGVQASMAVLQALNMNRHLGTHFKFPAGSILVLNFIATALSLSMLDRLVFPTWHRLIGRPATPLQRIGVGHVLNITSMAVSAIVEWKRRGLARVHHASPVAHMSVMWLVPQLVIVGLGEAFYFPGQVALYYQEFPKSLKNMATAMVAMLVAIAFYLSTAVIDLLRRTTGWLPDNIDDGRVDNVFWVLLVVGVINFGYYLLCGRLYRYQNAGENEDGGS